MSEKVDMRYHRRHRGRPPSQPHTSSSRLKLTAATRHETQHLVYRHYVPPLHGDNSPVRTGSERPASHRKPRTINARMYEASWTDITPVLTFPQYFSIFRIDVP